MGNAARLFRDDMRRLFANTMSIIITLGLIIVPSLFSWYNIIACWNVFDNTGNLTVAVANADEGFQSDLVPIKVNVGDQVISALRANDQIDWVFTDEDDAIDGAKAGRYYAAVVIPPQFSRDMLTFYTADAKRADIVYYANEKKSAIAPKITDKGADSVSYQINAVFAETISEVSLSLADAVSSFADESDWDGRIAALADHVREMAGSFDDAASVLSLYGSLARSCQSLAENSAALATQAGDTVDATIDAATTRADTVPATSDALKEAGENLSKALSQAGAGFSAVSSSADKLFDIAQGDMAATAGDLRDQAGTLDEHATRYRDLAESLGALSAKLPSDVRPDLDAMVKRLNAVADQVGATAQDMRAAADKLDRGDGDISAERDKVAAQVAQAAEAIDKIKGDYEGNLKPALQQLVGDARDVASRVQGVSDKLGGIGNDLASASSSAGAVMGDAAAKIDDAVAKLGGVSENLRAMADDIDAALAAGDRDALRDVLGSDVSTLSRALAAPVGVERVAVFPVANFGSAMAPLYTTLAIYIGALLILVTTKPNVSERSIREAGLRNAKPRQLFCGRFGVMAFISLCQTTVMALGNMLFLQVQVVHPLLYLLCFWLAGLVFTFVIYALVAAFANLGKAIAVLLLIVQVTGCGGSFPLQLLPGFIQAISPWLPATHVVDAMRAAMMGAYGNDYWVQMGTLALFAVPAALLGLVLRKPLAKFMTWYVEKVESSKLVG